MINLWQLHVFLEVAETGSFSAAAVRLHMTQPGVSQQIRALENHLGTQLFVRRGHGVELTASGYDLQEPARRMIHLSEMTERTLMSRRGQVSGRVRLGCALTSAPYNINPWLFDFRNEHPDVTVQIEYTEPGPMIGALRAQELDGGFVLGRMRGRGLVHHRIMEDPITLIVPLNHSWTSPTELGLATMEFSKTEGRAGQAAGAQADGRVGRYEDGWVPAVKPAMLKDQPMVLEHGIGESHSDSRRALNDALEERGLNTRDLRVVLEVPDPAAVAFAVAEGVGLGLVPQSIAHRFIGQVVPVRVEGLTLAQHVYLIRDRKALNSPAVGAWWKFVDDMAARRTQEAGPQPEADQQSGPPPTPPAEAPQPAQPASSRQSTSRKQPVRA